MWQNSNVQNVTKPKNSKCYKTQKQQLKNLRYERTQNPKCDKT